MASAREPEYTPVRTPRGKSVHAMTITALKPACGKKRPRGGWRVACLPLTCKACARKLVFPVRRGAKPVARKGSEVAS